MGSGFSKMKKQAKMMQEQFSQMQNSMENTLVEGSAGNGLVTVTLNGAKALKKISIRPECVSDIEALQDLIVAAFENGAEKLDRENQGLSSTMPFLKGF
jgi:DNA-binding YbaB/EbfC family protein